jgi:hypothetical protein
MQPERYPEKKGDNGLRYDFGIQGVSDRRIFAVYYIIGLTSSTIYLHELSVQSIPSRAGRTTTRGVSHLKVLASQRRLSSAVQQHC